MRAQERFARQRTASVGGFCFTSPDVVRRLIKEAGLEIAKEAAPTGALPVGSWRRRSDAPWSCRVVVVAVFFLCAQRPLGGGRGAARVRALTSISWCASFVCCFGLRVSIFARRLVLQNWYCRQQRLLRPRLPCGRAQTGHERQELRHQPSGWGDVFVVTRMLVIDQLDPFAAVFICVGRQSTLAILINSASCLGPYSRCELHTS